MDNINDIEVNNPEFVTKQETLEEVTERIAENFKNVDFKAGVIYGIIEGAKWQQEQDKNKFSDEDMVAFLDWSKTTNKEKSEYELKCLLNGKEIDSKKLFIIWFKQFKKI
jgi:hypothetical protein